MGGGLIREEGRIRGALKIWRSERGGSLFLKGYSTLYNCIVCKLYTPSLQIMLLI